MSLKSFLLRFVALLVLSQGLFLGFYIVARQINPDPIVYYSGLRVVIYSTIVFCGTLWLLRRGLPLKTAWLNLQFVLPIVVIKVLLGYSFVITIPSLLDRSISIYIISAVAQSGERGLTLPEIQQGFLRSYVEGTTTVEKRLHEQLVSKNFTERDGRYRITGRGEFTYRVNRGMARLFRIPPKYTEPPTP